ncbi:hypothetical protein JZ751_011840 [Albula glossodonta]|uniref:WD repeat domain 41 n=1 Tax=Albula glossodonta TaxID=121402 RepID=A0A8T2PQX2_9TELE|nr:hypothetical protein JZ751_011840 [Albula glossodonta]
MLRWILGGREAQGAVEKNTVLVIGEEQPKNSYTELQVLKGHFDIVRFLVQIDDFRFASAGDDGLVLVWNAQTGERLQELRGHSQQITAMTAYSWPSGDSTHTSLITASSDRTLSLWDPDTGNRVQTVSDLQSSAKTFLTPARRGMTSSARFLGVYSHDLVQRHPSSSNTNSPEQSKQTPPGVAG